MNKRILLLVVGAVAIATGLITNRDEGDGAPKDKEKDDEREQHHDDRGRRAGGDLGLSQVRGPVAEPAPAPTPDPAAK